RITLIGERCGERSCSRKSSSRGSRHSRELHKLTIGVWTGERGEPAIVHAKLQLVAGPGHGQVVDQIDLALLDRSGFTNVVLSGTWDEQPETAIRGRVPGGEQDRIGQRYCATEIVQSGRG